MTTQDNIGNQSPSRNIEDCRKDFPIFNLKENESLVYFDNAASTQKPLCVIQEITDFYSYGYSNIHRGLYPLSLNASDKYEHARENIKKFINAKKSSEIIFTKGTTEGINLLAHCLATSYFQKGDEIILSILEHHSNIVPWQVLAKNYGLIIQFIYTNEDCEISLEKLHDLISPRTKLISITHISNAIGTINPVEEIIRIAKKSGILVMIDGAQSIGHMPIDVQIMGCDFFVFSGHKIYGPTGTGILYCKEEHLKKFTPYQTGGNQIKSVSIQNTEFAESPYKFEAGTPNISGVLGLSKSIDYIQKIGFNLIEAHENMLTKTLLDKLNSIQNISIVGNQEFRSGIISIALHGINPLDAGILFGQAGICVRTGFHCNEPLMNYLNLNGTIRISFALYNNLHDIEIFIEKLNWVKKMLKLP